MRKLFQAISPKKLTAAAVLFLLAVLAEWIFFSSSSQKSEYPRQELPADGFSFWEMDAMGETDFYMLSYNSYFSIENLGGRPVYAIDIYLSRPIEDITECVVRFVGIKDGISGEFVVPLTKTADGLYCATVDAEALDSFKIFPTERVRTTLSFDGATLNPFSASSSYSLARVLLWMSIASALYTLYIFIARKRKKQEIPCSLWLFSYLWITGLCLTVVFLATTIFESARGLHSLLIPAAFAGITALYGTVWFIVKKISSFPMKAAAFALAAGCLMCFATAPLQVPDEAPHFLRAYSLSQGDFSFDRDHAFPDDVKHLLQLFPAEFYNHVQRTGSGNALSRIVSYLSVYKTPYAGEDVRDINYIQLVLPYLPSALGMTFTRWLGGEALACLYAGRICNALVTSICLYFALTWAARFRGILLATALLPLTLFMTSSLSYDAAFFWGLLLFLGFVLKKDIRSQHVLAGILAFALMISIKSIYLPLALLVFTIPKEHFLIAKKRIHLFALMLVCAFTLWLFTLLYANWARIGILSLPPPEGVDVAAQVLYVLKNPLRYLMVLLVDGYMNLFYLGQFGLFGWLDVSAPLTGLLTPIFFVLVSALHVEDTRRILSKKDILLSALTLLLGYTVIVTAFYCTWSSLGGTSVLGVQARYLIPFLPCLLVLLSRATAPVFSAGTSVGIARPSADLRDNICLYLLGSLSLLSSGEIAVTYFLR